jgi:pyridoxamine 5'-phosphate oxidase
MNTPSLADMRKNYQQAELLESNAAADPLEQFTLWLNQALSAEIPEANAMTLATVSSDLRPSTRVVLIKGFDDKGLVWFTNYDSRKGLELNSSEWCASRVWSKKSATPTATIISTRVHWRHA